jgi:GEVED domain
LPNATATGDDANNLADEDGVVFLNPVLVGTQAWVNVVLTSPTGTGKLDAWLDFDQSGVWDAGEKVFNNLALVSGLNTLSFSVPTNASVGPTFARFRLSSAGGLLPSGAASDGEVEDYQVILRQYRPSTNIVITNIVLTASNATVYWTAETNVHYWLLGTTNLGIGMTNWTRIGTEVIGPANSQVETIRWPTNRFYRVVAPYLWP